MVDFATFGRGGVVYPLVSSTANQTVQDADPAIFVYLDFFAHMITTHVGARMMAEVASTNATQISAPVAYTFPDNPLPYMQEEMFKFPLLAMWREKEQIHGRTVVWDEDVTEMSVAYILPPLSPEQAERILPLRKSVRDIVTDRTHTGMDPTYTPPGGNQGDQVNLYSGVDEIRFTEGTFGTYQLASSNLYYPVWTGKLRVKAREKTPAGSFSTFQGTDATVNLQDGATGTVVSGVVSVSTTSRPTVTTITPSTGPVAGGASVVINGTFFEKGATVTIGGVSVPAQVMSSSTIWATSPAHAAGTGSVVVTNPDSSTATFVNGFTFS